MATLVSFAITGVAAAAVVRDLPDPKLTPGAVTTHDARAVCTIGYARGIRPRGAAWRTLRNEVYARYGIRRGERSALDARGRRHSLYVIDHLIPIELGGAPADIRNLWPQPRAAAERKDHVENELHARVCSGHMALDDAQRLIARDWRVADHARR